ncbi:MAG: hypothetical protein KBT03_03180 [Bacteroidales bacterium]|nr:hypothetical protein [Candidatus Scybalousia scybalohippi]
MTNFNDVVSFGKLFDTFSESTAEKLDCFLTDNEFSPFLITSHSSKTPTVIEIYDVLGKKYTQNPIIISWNFNAKTEYFELYISFSNVKIETICFENIFKFTEFITSQGICDKVLEAITSANKFFNM